MYGSLVIIIEHCSGQQRRRAFQGPIPCSLHVAISRWRHVKILPVQAGTNRGGSRRDGNARFKISWPLTCRCHVAGWERDPLGRPQMDSGGFPIASQLPISARRGRLCLSTSFSACQGSAWVGRELKETSGRRSAIRWGSFQRAFLPSFLWKRCLMQLQGADRGSFCVFTFLVTADLADLPPPECCSWTLTSHLTLLPFFFFPQGSTRGY